MSHVPISTGTGKFRGGGERGVIYLNDRIEALLCFSLADRMYFFVAAVVVIAA